ncbi:hypothetical protein MUK72_00125 [Halococcus dombrowskii]|uniref:Uncharacterized protein n=1 Tax=Halococcus dombrowskii TaxID=179637 RepID=A0AAV3SD88_HALDO|nr:hypothetical protein [Halococcus dombrowskii]UOO95150.1 hypothetical protein MUK72_00125 [Halococcus dombrowskii]
MRHSPTEFKAAVTSGDSDRVNATIEEVKDAEMAECAYLFVNSIEVFSNCYYVENGYQRLSVIRFLRQLYTAHLPIAYRDLFWELLLDAIVDEDGRVRKAALKAMDKVIFFTGYREQSVEPMRTDLAEIADTHVPTYSEIHSALKTAEKNTGKPL